MQAATPPEPIRTIHFKQFKVVCPKDDTTTIPLFYNQWVKKPDITWVTPLRMFQKKVSGARSMGVSVGVSVGQGWWVWHGAQSMHVGQARWVGDGA